METNTLNQSGIRAGRREWIGLAVLALPTLLLSIDMSVLYLALPHLAADLQPSSSQMLWIMDIYGFMVAGFLVTMGTLGDRIGRRRLLLIGASAFTIASVVAAYSQSAEMLIAARTLLGIAGATLMPSTLALISNMFKDARQRGTAIAVWMSAFMGGTAFGPVVGGVMLEWFWWGSAFLLGVPVMVLLLITGPVLLPEYRNENAGRLDLASVGLSLATILPIIYALKELAKSGPSATPLVAVVAGLAVGAVFVRRQLRLADPLLDLRLFGNRSFRSSLGVMFVGTFFMGGLFLFVSQYMQLVAGYSPLGAGLWLVPASAAMIVTTNLAPRLAARYGPWPVISGGMVLAAVGLVVVTQAGTDGAPVMMAGLLIAAVGLGPGGALATDIVVGSAPPEKAGSAASISGTSGDFGIAAGVAVLGSLGTAVYRSQVEVPEGASAEVATAVNDSLPSAIVAAEHLSAGIAAQVLDGARVAYTNGLNIVAALAAVTIFVVALLFLVRMIRRHPATGEAAETVDIADSGETATTENAFTETTAAPAGFDQTDPTDDGQSAREFATVGS